MVVLETHFGKQTYVLTIGVSVRFLNVLTGMPRLNSDQISEFILKQLDAAELGHNTFNDDALALIIRSSEGIIRRSRNLCISTLLETVRLRKRIVDLETVNRVLIQPHWRTQTDFD